MLVWQRGLAPSRAKARALILAGQIAVNGERTTRAGTPVDLQATVTRLGATSPYVSRGGEKLAAALAAFDLTVHGRVAMDVGASTGGFTDCLLQAGALRVYAVDVGYGQLHWRLRTDPRVIVYERTNARYLQPEDVPERIAVLTVDVSFISLRLLLPVLVRLLEPQADSVVLIKPQFEVGKGQVGKSGVVHDPQQHQQVLWDILTAAQDCGFGVRAAIASPLLGPKGNREFLAHLQLGAAAMPPSRSRSCAHAWHCPRRFSLKTLSGFFLEEYSAAANVRDWREALALGDSASQPVDHLTSSAICLPLLFRVLSLGVHRLSPIAPTTTRPVLSPRRTCIDEAPSPRRSCRARWISSAAKTARLAWSSWAMGAPNSAMKPSPRN